MDEELYIFKMIDTATPSFCTFYKEYAGTLDNIKVIYSEIKKKFTDEEDLCHEILVKQSMEEYFNGNKNATNKGIYGEEPIFVPTNIIDRCKHEIQNKKIIHNNTWDFEYKLRFTKCLIENIITQNKGTSFYKVFVKFTFYNLEMFREYLKNWKEVKGPTWGNPGVLIINEESENNVIYTPVYLEDKKFDDLNEAKKYISDDNQINYSTVFNEIFGDG